MLQARRAANPPPRKIRSSDTPTRSSKGRRNPLSPLKAAALASVASSSSLSPSGTSRRQGGLPMRRYVYVEMKCCVEGSSEVDNERRGARLGGESSSSNTGDDCLDLSTR